MKFSKFDLRMFNAAHVEAEKSDYERFHVGCVITYKKKIIGRGHNSNKSSPLQAEYNKYRNFNNTEGCFIRHSIHAEIHAISSVAYATGIEVEWSKASVYVYRICPGKELGYGDAKPCPACMNALKDLGIKNIYYTDDDGYNYLHLED